MTKLKIGDKAIIINSHARNEGKIVVVIDYCTGEFTSPSGAFFTKENHDVIVKSLGRPFNTRQVGGIIMREFTDVGPINSKNLRKLPEVDEPELELTEDIK